MARMRIAAQWFIVLVLIALATLLVSCPNDGGNEVAGVAPSNKVVEDMYNKNCAICHGASLEGRPTMAPALVGSANHWPSAEELAKYLANPQDYANADTRLRHAHDTYSLRMPAIPTMSDADRLAMAKWVLQH